MRHFTIPIFIPMQACPHRCIYCDQHAIAGHSAVLDAAAVIDIIHDHLATLPADALIDVGFFGGTFTGLVLARQEALLQAVQPFLISEQVQSIRLSTRPDMIDEKVLALLKRMHVGTIELGAQSMDDEVLRFSERGHDAACVEKAARMIKAAGFRLGLQMMTGLPGDASEKSLATAKKFVALLADDVRIYPAVVVRGTSMAELYARGEYAPQSLQEAVELVAALVPLFEDAGIRIIRMGLHPSEGLLDGGALMAGPFHVSFGELVQTELWRQKLEKIDNPKNYDEIIIRVAAKARNAAIGYRAANRRMLEQHFKKVRFVADAALKARDFYVDYR
jgi:histone acetyltransferase (RNA polymerase elongator complex component)